MYKRVENEIEQAMFHFIWMTAWREKGFEFEFARHVLDRYLVITPDMEYVGSIEFKPYDPQHGAVNEVAPFQSHPLVRDARSRVAEVDKVALLPEYRGKYIAELLTAAVHFAREGGYDYYVSLLDPVFYRALRITFKVPMSKVGKEVYYKGGNVVPVLFHMKEMVDSPERYEWLSEQYGNAARVLLTEYSDYIG
ncbi:N-acetyltransferase [Xylanibacillus composti]|uniref:N-acetyltransferase domain-containing protein n=1 Tax=Xylanibacillus composti TaxID=1572762 RepID=A0A8J4H683_9BACL|nr:GNAT family N-acetyltransferase [Xylanibacillus composti]MDT9726384.1 N-acetyltransferase [Xylanibacillus composti]GIQ70377.1 hypothetical protein XYCOK13_32010 [Xylanibacillus composti]